MPSTTNFNWTTPADTDLVKDGAAAIRTLGNGIDTSLVDLKGGTTGQVLSKNSNTDLDYTWVTPNVGDITEVQAGTGISVASGTGPIPVVTNTVATAYDAKGDLIVGTGADTFAKLTVGTNGHTLVADSGETTGLKWAAPSSPSFVGCSLYNTAAQTIANNTATAITFNSELYDTDGFHSTSSNTSRITIPSGKGGYYNFQAYGEWSNNTSGRRWFYLRKNGSTIAEFESNPNVGTASISGWLFYMAAAAVGDYFEIIVDQSSGGNLDINFGNTVGIFQCVYLGA